MAKKTDSKNEWKRIKKFEHENEKLRKEVSKLRKYARDSFIDKLEQGSERTDNGHSTTLLTCENCGNHDVHSINIERKDGNFEIRICKSCENRTEMKKIKKKSKD